MPSIPAASILKEFTMSSTIALHAEDYRLSGYSDLETLQDAFAAWLAQGGELHLAANGVYDLGDRTTPGDVLPPLVNFHNAILCGNGATIRINTDDTVTYSIFYMWGVQQLRFKDLTIEDTGFVRDSGTVGASIFDIDGATPALSRHISFENVHVDGALVFLRLQGHTYVDGEEEVQEAPRIDGIHISPNCSIRNCFYGLSCQENGDNITGGFTAKDVGRAYFPYGVSDHDLTLDIEQTTEHAAVETCCLIKRYARDTRNIRARIVFRGSYHLTAGGGSPPPGCFVKLEMQPPEGTSGTIDNIDLTIELDENIVNTNQAHVLGFRSYLHNGTEETSTTDNIWSNIRLDGTFRNTSAQNVKAYVNPTTRCLVSLAPGLTGASPWHLPKLSGFVYRTTADSQFHLRRGDLTSAPIAIDLSGLDAEAFTLKLKTYAHGDETTLALQNSVYREDIVTGYNGGGGGSGVAVMSTQSCFSPLVAGTGPTVTIGASGETLTVSFAGGDYDNSTSYARVGVEFVSRGDRIRG
jgi:hypothetical protein